MTAALDLLVIGSGVAGLSAAVRAARRHSMSVGVMTKGRLDEATTRWAQGGVAAVLGGGDPDSTDLHLSDTLAAGVGLCDSAAVRVLVDEGPGRVEELIALGARFDQDPDGRLARAREGGHSHARVVHSGGTATGIEVERALVEAVRASAAVLHEGWFAVDLLVEAGRCCGVTAVDPAGQTVVVRAANVLLATGGAGQLYAVTTNPPESTGDGIAMAMRADVAVTDLEFVQFHPTALHTQRSPRPLLSEALRGHGALLRNGRGERFVDELEPRDVVSSAITAELIADSTDHVFLDATGLDEFERRFPNIASSLAAEGLDPSCDLLPVAPAAHYVCGGVATDLDGATTMPRLWAAGEAASAGIHGANRLASNSLLDGMVFGARVVEAIGAGRAGPSSSGIMGSVLGQGPTTDGVRCRRIERAETAPSAVVHDREGLQASMTRNAGVLRDASSLAAAAEYASGAVATECGADDVAGRELVNLATVALGVIGAAAAREESRGAHTRTDFADTDAAAVRLVQ